jgi:hypothetical protein
MATVAWIACAALLTLLLLVVARLLFAGIDRLFPKPRR